jgi:hypothetical protein
MSDVDTKIKFTFELYDFQKLGRISPEYVRLIMSYIPFVRDTDGETPNTKKERQQHFF